MEEIKTSAKAACDPGWNDPPLFSYDSRATAQGKSEKRGNILNKRVAFPMQQNASNSSSPLPPPIDPTLPPQPCNPATFAPPPSATLATTKAETKDKPEQGDEEQCDFNSELALSISMKNLNETLENRLDNTEIQEKATDIRKRLDMIEKLWVEKKFSMSVQQKILKLSKALKSGDNETADHLQRGLVVDHPTLCSSWMSGIRHLLHASTSVTSSSNERNLSEDSIPSPLPL